MHSHITLLQPSCRQSGQGERISMFSIFWSMTNSKSPPCIIGQSHVEDDKEIVPGRSRPPGDSWLLGAPGSSWAGSRFITFPTFSLLLLLEPSATFIIILICVFDCTSTASTGQLLLLPIQPFLLPNRCSLLQTARHPLIELVSWSPPIRQCCCASHNVQSSIVGGSRRSLNRQLNLNQPPAQCFHAWKRAGINLVVRMEKTKNLTDVPMNVSRRTLSRNSWKPKPLSMIG